MPRTPLHFLHPADRFLDSQVGLTGREAQGAQTQPCSRRGQLRVKSNCGDSLRAKRRRTTNQCSPPYAGTPATLTGKVFAWKKELQLRYAICLRGCSHCLAGLQQWGQNTCQSRSAWGWVGLGYGVVWGLAIKVWLQASCTRHLRVCIHTRGSHASHLHRLC